MRINKQKPAWLKVKLPSTPTFNYVSEVLADLHLHAVCREARCPNIAECFHLGTVTFLILGDLCTRNCLYCNVRHGIPDAPRQDEPARVAEAVKRLGLHYIVITSVTRDDLPDGGADLFSQCIRILRKDIPNCKVEVLIPDFQGNWDALDLILDARPDVINHNMEVVRRLFSAFRPQGNYDLSLELIERVGRHSIDISTKSGFMVGLGEERIDIVCLLEDLIRVGCQHLTIGQYQQPTLDKCPVERYYPPNEFTELKQIALQMGFRHVESGPLIRSSYHAAKTIGR